MLVDSAGRLIANGLDRRLVAIIYDVAVCTLYKKFPRFKTGLNLLIQSYYHKIYKIYYSK
ncbi:hypothetical protein AWI28_02955 [Enterobacter genomosp. O]|uniref:Resolvase HTH domain-containing protein n=1 Tax=Enterobacter genomosp. O TaxID=2364150 RepID=A0A0X4EF97_9ENTR|nr:hypothetical protein AWI28_02955 [Enterobacter genomosp. O]